MSRRASSRARWFLDSLKRGIRKADSIAKPKLAQRPHSPSEGPLSMNLARLVLKGSSRWAIPLGSALLSLSAGCAGPGHPATDAAVDRILAPAVESAQPIRPAEDSGVRTIGLLS